MNEWNRTEWNENNEVSLGLVGVVASTFGDVWPLSPMLMWLMSMHIM
jgi:hypothetical protein